MIVVVRFGGQPRIKRGCVRGMIRSTRGIARIDLFVEPFHEILGGFQAHVFVMLRPEAAAVP